MTEEVLICAGCGHIYYCYALEDARCPKCWNINFRRANKEEIASMIN